ncbi:MAG: hypothetical protein ABFS32_17185, partial [Bacteroidota bacterium]
MIKKFFIFLIFFALSQYAMAQCGESLVQARDAFDAGHLEEVSGHLNECLNKSGSNGFTREQKVEAYRLLTITYLYLDDPFGAEQSFLKLLEEDPEYRILPTDPVELEYLSRKFISSPIISYTAKIGPNLSTATILHYNTMSPEGDLPVYKTNLGIQVAGAAELHFNKMVGINLELDIGYISLEKSITLFPEQDFMIVKSNRHMLTASLPVTLRFTYPGMTYYPYVYGGYKPSLTI